MLKIPMPSQLFNTEESVIREYGAFSAAVRDWVQFIGFDRAIKAHDVGAQYHTGLRKDGTNPEFSHQQSQALYILSLLQSGFYPLIDPEGCVALTFLHDLPEEHGINFSELSQEVGEDIASCAFRMAKTYRGQPVYASTEDYYKALSGDPVASIVKCADRIHNLATLVGAFSPEKAREYLLETRTHYPKMIARAKELFPKQKAAYSAMERMISVLCQRTEVHLKELGILPCLPDTQLTLPPHLAFSQVPSGVHPLSVLRGRCAHGVPNVKVDKHALPVTLSPSHLKLVS